MSINVHIINFRLLHEIKILFLRDLLLEHFHFLLILLNTVMDAVNQDVSIYDLLLGESMGSLLVSETASSSRSNKRTLLCDLDFLGFYRCSLNIISDGKCGAVNVHFNFGFFWLSNFRNRSIWLRNISNWLLLLGRYDIGFRLIVNELASHSIWTVPIGAILFAKFSLV